MEQVIIELIGFQESNISSISYDTVRDRIFRDLNKNNKDLSEKTLVVTNPDTIVWDNKGKEKPFIKVYGSSSSEVGQIIEIIRKFEHQFDIQHIQPKGFYSYPG